MAKADAQGLPRQPRRRIDVRAVATAGGFYALFCALFASLFYTPPYEAEVGKPATKNVVAPEAMSILDRAATAKQAVKFLTARPQLWVRDTSIVSTALQRVHQFFELLNAHEPSSAAELRVMMATARTAIGVRLDDASAAQFLSARLNALNPPQTRATLERALQFALKEALIDHGIVENKTRYMTHHGSGVLRIFDEHKLPISEIPDPAKVLAWPTETRQFLANIALARQIPGDDTDAIALRQAAADLLTQAIGPNLTYDVTGTNRLYESQRARMQLGGAPDWNDNNGDDLIKAGIVKTFVPGEVIVKQGETLNQLQAEALQRLNERRTLNMRLKLVGIALMLATVFCAVALYLKRFRVGVVLDAATIGLHALPPLFAVAIAGIFVRLGQNSNMVGVLYPSVLLGSLATILITPQVAFILVLVSALTFGVIMNLDISFMIMSLFPGFAAVLTTRQIRARTELFRVGLKVGLVNLFTLLLLGLLGMLRPETTENRWIWLITFLAAMFYSLLVPLLTVFFERRFRIVTDLKLLELTGLQHPLLLMLEEKAPGSFQHVLSVTKLAETAANAIGANYLLVRAGAYFHDVGKMLSPKYFSENQTSIEDKRAHSKISPYMSVLIIKNHVKEGVKLAHDAGLPQRVVDFIPEHHGTGLIRYFYNEAVRRYEESETVDPVREEDFRYPGPKPRSIETAIVMIADTVEATTTSKFTGGQVQEIELRRVVQGAITEKFNDGQFDECSLTLRHLHLIREALVKALMARYHFRVQYPGGVAGARPSATVQNIPRSDAPIAISGPAA